MYCLKCDYPLDSLSESRCPECGRSFDPAHPETFRSITRGERAVAWVHSWIVVLAASELLNMTGSLVAMSMALGWPPSGPNTFFSLLVGMVLGLPCMVMLMILGYLSGHSRPHMTVILAVCGVYALIVGFVFFQWVSAIAAV